MAKQVQKRPAASRVLRIGVFQNNNCLEERLIHSKKPVTVGQDFRKNTFVVAASNLPKTMTVFDVKDGKYVLNFTSKMTGRVSLGDGKPTKLKDLIQSGRAKKTSSGYAITLDQRTFGRVAFRTADEEVALLFQFVKPPPPRARPVLPASMRGGLIYGVLGATTLAITVAISAVLQIGFVAFVMSRDWPEPLGMEYQLPDRFVSLLAEKEEEPIEVEPVETEEGDGPGEVEDDDGEPVPDEKEPEEKAEPKSAEERAKAEADRKRRLAAEVQNKTILGQIGALSSDGGSLVDSLSQGAGQTSMEDAFANSTGVKTGVAGAEKSGLKTSGSSDADGKGSAVGIGDLGKLKGTDKANKGVKTGAKAEKKVKVRVNLKTPNKMVGSGKLDSSSVSKVIRRRQSQIQKCYEREIKKNPKASGKVTVNFTIGRAGRVTKARAGTDSVGGGVGKCVAGVIKRFKFPRPKGGEVMVNKTFIFEVAK